MTTTPSSLAATHAPGRCTLVGAGPGDRDHLCRWMNEAVAIEGGIVTDKYAFNVLEVGEKDDCMVFWRSNEAMGAFQTYASEEWQASRQKKKEASAQDPKGSASSHSDAGTAYAHGWGEGSTDADPWGRYKWSQPSNPKGGKGWYQDD